MADSIAQFNARSILIQDGFVLSYASGDPLAIDISLSNFGPSDLPADTKLTWAVLLNGKAIKAAEVSVRSVAQGTLGVVASIAFILPDVGTSDSVPFGAADGPKTLTLTTHLTGNAFATQVPRNSWNSTLFPRWRLVASPTTAKAKVPIKVTSAALLPPSRCGFSDCKLGDSAPTAPPAVYLTTTITDALIERVKNGSVLVLLENSTAGFFKTAMTPFKQAWWLGNTVDCNAGTLVYPSAAAILGGMAPENYADQSWWRMVNGAQTFLLDEMPTLPGSWSSEQKGVFGAQDGCLDHGQGGCPADFPFLTHAGPPLAGKICYKTQAAVAASEGPCGSWCTTDINAGGGCGSNTGHLCPAVGSSCRPALNASTCEAMCDANAGCNAINYNSTSGCCLENCLSAQLGPPKDTTGGCCGYYRTTGGPMPKRLTVMMRAIDVVGLSRNKALLWTVPVGDGHIVSTGLNLFNRNNASVVPYPEQAWVLDRLLRYAVSLV